MLWPFISGLSASTSCSIICRPKACASGRTRTIVTPTTRNSIRTKITSVSGRLWPTAGSLLTPDALVAPPPLSPPLSTQYALIISSAVDSP